MYLTDAILIMEHSFYLAQQNDPQPVSCASKKYKTSDISAKVKDALDEVFQQYNKASEREQVDIILKIILQNCMGGLDMPFNTSLINICILDPPASQRWHPSCSRRCITNWKADVCRERVGVNSCMTGLGKPWRCSTCNPVGDKDNDRINHSLMLITAYSCISSWWKLEHIAYRQLSKAIAMGI